MRPTIALVALLLFTQACSSPTEDKVTDLRLSSFLVDSIGGLAMNLGPVPRAPTEFIFPRWSASIAYPFGFPLIESDTSVFVIMDARISCWDREGDGSAHFAWGSPTKADSILRRTGASSLVHTVECTLIGDDEVRFRFTRNGEELTARVTEGEDGCAYLRMRLPRETTMQWGGVRYMGEDIPPTIVFPQPTPVAVFKDWGCL